MNYFGVLVLIAFFWGALEAKECTSKKLSSKLFCYYSKITNVDSCKCTHVILPANSDVKAIERLRDVIKGVKILITVNEFNEGLVNLLKNSKVDGLEVKLNKLDSKNDIPDFISTVKDKLGSDLYITVSVPGKPELLAKFYDFKVLSKKTDAFILQTAFMGANKNVTFHPSRLSGLWDMQNTDSMVDLVSGLGAPLSKLVITTPVQAFQFTLQRKEHTAPGSPATALQSLTRDELCEKMKSGKNWTLERDQDQAGPYIFSGDQWIAFDDSMSLDIKAKYTRVRGLAGIALKDVSQDGGSKCDGPLLDILYNGLSKQARAPRGAVLHSLEREILQTPARPLDNIQVSPYRISRIIDVEGHVHVIRQDTRTEFACSRQGYFVHPRSCNRFYRCVKFDQRSDEFSVFEFDCPAGLAFDERVEVCVWPGSLPHASACSGSSEIAPVPRSRFSCPTDPGYYADPENCRWFFACLDHGETHMSAYEFRCPFGLVFDESRLMCEWPWIVPRCASGAYLGINLPSELYYGGQGAPSFVLEQYDGLGTLGNVHLGGLYGPIQQPLAKVYTNVGLAGSDGNTVGLDVNGLSTGGLGSFQGGYVQGNGVGLSQNIGAAYINNNLLKADSSGSNNYASGVGQTLVYRGQTSDAGAGIYGSSGSLNNGLSYNSVQSLQNAGLLKNSAGTQGIYSYQGVGDADDLKSLQYSDNLGTYGQRINTGSYSNVNAYSGQSQLASGLGSIAGTLKVTPGYSGIGLSTGQATAGTLGVSSLQGNEFVGASNYQSGGATLVGSGINGYYDGTASQGGGALGATTYKNVGTHVTAGNSGAAISGLNNGLDYSSGAVSVNNLNQVHSGAGGLQYTGVAHSNNYQTGGAVSSQSINQIYEANSAVRGNNLLHSDNVGTAGQANIVGQGYSFVGVTPSDVHVTNNGGPILSVTPSPIAVTTVSPVPTVTTVPVPVVSTAATIATYRGGVIANSPELQYKVTTPRVYYETNFDTVGNDGGFANISGSLNNYVSSTPSTVEGGYVYEKPSIPFVEQPVVRVTQGPVVSTYVEHGQENFGGYEYPKPQIAFEEAPVRPVSVFTPSTVRPAVVYHHKTVVTETPAVTFVTPKPVSVSSYSFQKQDSSGGYYYEKPSVVFDEKPQIKTSFIKTSYNIPSSTSRPVVYQHQPQVVTSYNIPSSTPRPAVIYQQQPQVVTSYNIPSSTPRPAVIYQQQPQVVTSYNIPSSTPRPSVVYTQRPQIVTTYNVPSPTPSPAVVYEQRPQVVTSYNIPSSTPRPAVVYHNQPQVYVSSRPAPVIPIIKQQPAVSTSFATFNQGYSNISNEGYYYEQPSIPFVEEPVQLSKTYLPQPVVQVPSYGYKKTVEIQKTVSPVIQHTFVKPPTSVQYIVPEVKPPLVQTYSYQKPSQVVYQSQPILPLVEQKPYMFSTYSYQRPVQQTFQPATHQTQSNQGGFFYSYQTPVQQTYIQPSVQKTVTYTQTQPMTHLVQQNPAVFSSYFYQQPIQKTVIQPAVTKYSYQDVVQNTVSSAGYSYPKPSIGFQEEPVAFKTQTYLPPSTVRPVVIQKQPQVYSTYITPTASPAVVIQKQPQAVSSFSYVNPTTARPAVVVQKQPTVVASYVPSSTPVPFVTQNSVEFSGYDYRKPAIPFNEEAVVEARGYDYPKPSVSFVEEPTPFVKTYEHRQPVQEVPFVAKKAYVTGHANYQDRQQFGQRINSWYRLEKPIVRAKPIVVEAYQPPSQVYVPSTTPSYVQNIDVGRQETYTYLNTPQHDLNYQLNLVTQKPTYVSTIASVVNPKLAPQGKQFYFYDSRLQSTPQPFIQTYSTPLPSIETVTTSRPIAKYEFGSYDKQYQYSSTPTPLVVSTTPEYQAPIEVASPVRSYLPSRVRVTTPIPTQEYIEISTPKSTYLPVKPSTYLPPPKVTYIPSTPSTYLPPKPKVTYLPSTPTYLPPAPKVSYLPVEPQVTVTTPTPIIQTKKIVEEYVAPELQFTPTREYLPAKEEYVVTPTKEYLPAREQYVVTPTREYLPTKEEYVVTPTREYLPTKGEYIQTTRRPAKIFTPAPKTIVKVNDFHPLLSAKLGAQCTCVSNTLRLRKKPKTIQLETLDNYRNAEYTNQLNTARNYVGVEHSTPVVVENYEYEPQRTIAITPAPQVIKDTVYPVETPSHAYKVRQRVKVRPLAAKTEAIEIFTPNVEINEAEVDDDKPSDREIASAVRTGLKLVKQAAREGAREGTKDVLEGRGGNARLSADIDCQRPGLFRHPNQCNKFYSCRWDCKKNRYTLHVFNCPVHLTFDNSLGACNWPSQGPACLENTLLPSD